METSLEVITDNSWQTTTGPILENDLLMGETYDAQAGTRSVVGTGIR